MQILHILFCKMASLHSHSLKHEMVYPKSNGLFIDNVCSSATSILDGKEDIFDDAIKKGPKTFLVSVNVF